MGKKRIIKRTQEDLLKDTERIETATKKEINIKAPQKIKQGRIYISSSYNNTILTLTDAQGNVLAGSSSGRMGFRGRKKATPFAASKVAENLSQAAEKLGITNVRVFVKGIGSGRDSALRALGGKRINITSIKDVTSVPHNGCRPPKPRRV